MYREEMVMRLQNGEDPLELSIEKWESLLEQAKTDANEFDGFEFSSYTCALCYVYRYVKNQVDCGSCPVFEATNLPYCHNTPYDKARSSCLYTDNRDEMVKYVQEEVDFLQNLRKE